MPAEYLFLRLAQRIRQALAGVCVWLLVVCPATSLAGAPQESLKGEYEWKANFLAKSADFVDWPSASLPKDGGAFRWCVFGTYSFGTSLAELTRSITVNGKHGEVKWIHKESELAGCQIIFVSRSEIKRYAKVLDAARPGHGLTVGETEDFLKAGGMVTLLMDGSEPAFEVNLEAVQAAQLKLSSRLLVLARRVVNHPGAAKG